MQYLRKISVFGHRVFQVYAVCANGLYPGMVWNVDCVFIRLCKFGFYCGCFL